MVFNDNEDGDGDHNEKKITITDYRLPITVYRIAITLIMTLFSLTYFFGVVVVDDDDVTMILLWQSSPANPTNKLTQLKPIEGFSTNYHYSYYYYYYYYYNWYYL